MWGSYVGCKVVRKQRGRIFIYTGILLCLYAQAACRTNESAPNDSRAYVERLVTDVLAKHRGQTVLVVSHSNTVPAIVERFGGKPVPAIGNDDYIKNLLGCIVYLNRSASPCASRRSIPSTPATVAPTCVICTSPSLPLRVIPAPDAMNEVR